MEELLNLTYKDEVEALKEEENFEALGDANIIQASIFLNAPHLIMTMIFLNHFMKNCPT